MTDGLKMINEEKLMQQDTEQNEEYQGLKKKQGDERDNLENVLLELKNDIVSQECKIQRSIKAEKRYREMQHVQESEAKKLREQLYERSQMIEQLE